MAGKLVRLSDKVVDYLEKHKDKKESFSQVIERLLSLDFDPTFVWKDDVDGAGYKAEADQPRRRRPPKWYTPPLYEPPLVSEEQVRQAVVYPQEESNDWQC